MKRIDRRWRKSSLRIGLLLVSALVLSGMSGAETLDEVINPKQLRNEWVSDMAGVIDAETRGRLNAVVHHLEQQTTAEIAVVTIRRTDGSTPKDFATALFKRWGVGKQGKDNGVLVLLVVELRRIEVEIGYGVEAMLPDGKVGQILRTHVVPRFKQADFGGGLLAGVQAMAEVIAAEPVEVTSGSPVLLSRPLLTLQPPRPIIASSWFLVLLGVAGVGSVLAGAGYAISRSRLRYCPQCHNKMRRLTEAQDHAYLAVDQKFEEELGSVDYRVWRCDGCQLCQVERALRWFGSYEDCPRCRHRTVSVQSHTLLEPTYERSGKKAVTRTCRAPKCGWEYTTQEFIPRRQDIVHASTSWSSGSGGGGSSGGSFGGRSSGGGGAGASW